MSDIWVESKLASEQGKYVLKSELVPALRNFSTAQKAMLQQRLERDLPSQLVDLDAIAIRKKMQQAVDEICAVMAANVGQWMDAPR